MGHVQGILTREISVRDGGLANTYTNGFVCARVSLRLRLHGGKLSAAVYASEHNQREVRW